MSTSTQFLPLMSQGQRDDHYVDVYANQLRISLTQADFSLIFGVTEDYGPGNIGMKDRVCVRVSPTSAKFILQQLEASLAAYEEAVGPISMLKGSENAVSSIKKHILAGFKAKEEELSKIASESDAPSGASQSGERTEEKSEPPSPSRRAGRRGS
jgi:hypothetical protein